MNLPSKSDQDRFSAFFMSVFSDLNAAIYSMLPDRGAVEEVLQNTSVVLWEKYWEVEDELEFRKIAFTVARFQVLSYRRDRMRNRMLFDEGIVSLLVDPATISKAYLTKEQEILEKCLLSLTAEERELIFASYQPGVKITEMAAREGKTPMSLYKKIQKIKARLFKIMQSEQSNQPEEQ